MHLMSCATTEILAGAGAGADASADACADASAGAEAEAGACAGAGAILPLADLPPTSTAKLPAPTSRANGSCSTM